MGDSTICHFDGETWNVTYPSGPHDAVWGASADAVYVVGGKTGHSLFYDGVEWGPGPFEYGLDLQALWGTPDVGVIGVGGKGLVAVWDGEKLETLLYGEGSEYEDFWSVWGNGHVLFLAGASTTPDRLVFHW